jgi:hypothetical protein
MKARNETFSLDCYVAFLDILGFKRISDVHSSEHLKLLYEKFYGIIEHGLSNGRYVLSQDDDKEYIRPDSRQATVNSLLISDSVLLWTNDGLAESFANIVEGVRSLLAFSIIGRIPLRGAISIAPRKLLLEQWPRENDGFKDSLFAKAFDDAAKAEKDQQWCGCEITEAAIECYRKNCGQAPLEKTHILFYPIPREEGQSDGFVVDWVNHQQAGINVQNVTNAFAPPINPNATEWEKFKSDEWPRVAIKLTNTIKFVEYVKSTENQVFVPWCSVP